MNQAIRTYRVRNIPPKSEIEDFDKCFLSKNFSKTSFKLNYKKHETSLKNMKNSHYLISQDDYLQKGMKIYSGIHKVEKTTTIEIIDDDQNIAQYDHYFIPNQVDFYVFPKDNIFFTKASKPVFKHINHGIEKKYDVKIPGLNVNIRKLVQNESNIIGVNIKPNTANCETLVGYGDNVQTDPKVKEVIENQATFLSNAMMKITLGGKPITVTITHDGGIVIYKFNEDLKDDLDTIFHVYENIIKKYI